MCTTEICFILSELFSMGYSERKIKPMQSYNKKNFYSIFNYPGIMKYIKVKLYAAYRSAVLFC